MNTGFEHIKRRYESAHSRKNVQNSYRRSFFAVLFSQQVIQHLRHFRAGCRACGIEFAAIARDRPGPG
jgi:hypothetical protein